MHSVQLGLMHRVQIYKRILSCDNALNSKVRSDMGLRETKRRARHEKIMETGLRLFTERGYAATTLDAIADESGIARRTFFHYFRSKEEIILAWQGMVPDELRNEIRRLGAATSPFKTVETALSLLARKMKPETAIMIGRIVKSEEQLIAGNQAKFIEMERAAFEALSALWPDEARAVGLRYVALTAVGAMRLSFDAWVGEECEKPLDWYLAERFAALRDELHLN